MTDSNGRTLQNIESLISILKPHHIVAIVTVPLIVDKLIEALEQTSWNPLVNLDNIPEATFGCAACYESMEDILEKRLPCRSVRPELMGQRP